MDDVNEQLHVKPENIWRLLLDFGFFYYNEENQALACRMSQQRIIREIVVKDKYTVINWLTSFWYLLKKEKDESWVRQCHWIAQESDRLFAEVNKVEISKFQYPIHC